MKICFANKVLLPLAIAAALWGSQASAATPINPTLGRAASEVRIDYVYLHQQYAESYNGTVPDREDGNIPGIAIFEGGILPSGFYVKYGLSYVDGSDAYNGQTQGGTPAVSRTQNEILDGSVRLGWAFATTANSAVAPYFTGGVHLWRRSLGGVVPYEEDYTNFWYGIGVAELYTPVRHLALSAHGSIGRTAGASMNMTGLSGIGIPDQNFTLGTEQRYTAGFDADYAFTRFFHANAGVDYTHFSYGVSEVNTVAGVGTLQEPDSTTGQLAYHVGIALSF
ncbi:MAG: hypothetical protein ACYDHY_09695 [Acidiferrobacterales bacterium]